MLGAAATAAQLRQWMTELHASRWLNDAMAASLDLEMVRVLSPPSAPQLLSSRTTRLTLGLLLYTCAVDASFRCECAWLQVLLNPDLHALSVVEVELSWGGDGRVRLSQRVAVAPALSLARSGDQAAPSRQAVAPFAAMFAAMTFACAVWAGGWLVAAWRAVTHLRQLSAFTSGEALRAAG